jgi:hypothetical protein
MLLAGGCGRVGEGGSVGSGSSAGVLDGLPYVRGEARVVFVLQFLCFCLFLLDQAAVFCTAVRERWRLAAAASSGMFGRPTTEWTEVLGNFLTGSRRL